MHPFQAFLNLLKADHPHTLLLEAPAVRPSWRADAHTLLDDLARTMRTPTTRQAYSAARAQATAALSAFDAEAARARHSGPSAFPVAPSGGLVVLVTATPQQVAVVAVHRPLGASIGWFGRLAFLSTYVSLVMAPLSPPPMRL